MSAQNGTPITLSLDCVVSVAGNQYTADLEGEMAILDYSAGTYFGLGDVSARIWKLIEQPCKVQQILATLLDEYEVEQTQCEQDLIQFLDKLYAKGLIQIV